MALILFDFDGVLADTLGDLIHFGQETCAELGIQRTATAADLDGLDNMSFADYGRQLGVPENRIDDFVQGCLKRFARKESPPAIFPNLERVIQKLAGSHTLVIVTGNSAKNVNAFLAEHGLMDRFQGIYGVDMAGTKSDKIAQARREHVKGGESIFMVGDSISDIRAARANSIPCIAVSWGHQSEKRLTAANPDHLIHAPAELLDIINFEE